MVHFDVKTVLLVVAIYIATPLIFTGSPGALTRYGIGIEAPEQTDKQDKQDAKWCP